MHITHQCMIIMNFNQKPETGIVIVKPYHSWQTTLTDPLKIFLAVSTSIRAASIATSVAPLHRISLLETMTSGYPSFLGSPSRLKRSLLLTKHSKVAPQIRSVHRRANRASSRCAQIRLTRSQTWIRSLRQRFFLVPSIRTNKI